MTLDGVRDRPDSSCGVVAGRQGMIARIDWQGAWVGGRVPTPILAAP